MAVFFECLPQRILIVAERNHRGTVLMNHVPCIERRVARNHFVGEFFPVEECDPLPEGQARKMTLQCFHNVVARDGDDEIVPAAFCLAQAVPVAIVNSVKDAEEHHFFHWG